MSSTKITYAGSSQTVAGGSDPISTSNANTEEFGKLLNDSQATGSQDMGYYLKLQQSMLKEQQVFQALSTIMKARFDSSTTAIRNFK